MGAQIWGPRSRAGSTEQGTCYRAPAMGSDPRVPPALLGKGCSQPMVKTELFLQQNPESLGNQHLTSIKCIRVHS